MILVPLVLSLTVHEWAHAWSASKLGDDTAERAGRLTLNPLVHLDLVGTVILPLLGIPFGWAKPVPVDPTRFRRDVRMASGMALTASAGPIANVVLSVLCTVVLGLLYRYAPAALDRSLGIRPLLVVGIQLNVSLALFNLLPVPPLDGSRIAEWLVPRSFRPQWEAFARLSPFLLLALMFFGGRIIARPSAAVLDLLEGLLNAIVVPGA